jgi:hypothetical protein
MNLAMSNKVEKHFKNQRLQSSFRYLRFRQHFKALNSQAFAENYNRKNRILMDAFLVYEKSKYETFIENRNTINNYYFRDFNQLGGYVKSNF